MSDDPHGRRLAELAVALRRTTETLEQEAEHRDREGDDLRARLDQVAARLVLLEDMPAAVVVQLRSALRKIVDDILATVERRRDRTLEQVARSEAAAALARWPWRLLSHAAALLAGGMLALLLRHL